ncbi:MAG: tRNA 2-thiocytidine biosynthesis TtcA family protein [Mycoplasma sp.]
MQKIVGKILEADKIFGLIEDGDRICVGISGGKDSMLLLFALNIIAKKQNKKFTLVGVHLKMNLCAVDYDAMAKFWEKQNVEFHLEDTHMGEILKAQMKKGKIQCSLCSKMKKAILIDAAKKYGCNKVAMGHHADDAIETLFLNLINEGRMAVFKPKMYLDRSDVWFIRPMITCRERNIISATNKLDMPILPCGCPMEGYTQRDTMKEFLEKNFYGSEKWRASYKNFYIALMNGKQADLWFIDEQKEVIDIDLRSLGLRKTHK